VIFLLLIQAALSAWEMLLYMGAGHGQQVASRNREGGEPSS
jgi:hypothetical protein